MAVGSDDEQIRPIVHCLAEHDLCNRSVIRSHPSDMHAGARARKIQSDIDAGFLAMVGTSLLAAPLRFLRGAAGNRHQQPWDGL